MYVRGLLHSMQFYGVECYSLRSTAVREVLLDVLGKVLQSWTCLNILVLYKTYAHKYL